VNPLKSAAPRLLVVNTKLGRPQKNHPCHREGTPLWLRPKCGAPESFLLAERRLLPKTPRSRRSGPFAQPGHSSLRYAGLSTFFTVELIAAQRSRETHLLLIPTPARSRDSLMREYVWLECSSCGDRNYRVQKETRGAGRLELKKYCRRERKHTAHKESRKK
jgi:large subunit ribosomal protein L33